MPIYLWQAESDAIGLRFGLSAARRLLRVPTGVHSALDRYHIELRTHIPIIATASVRGGLSPMRERDRSELDG